MYQSKVREEYDEVQQFGYQAVHYLEGCGRMQLKLEDYYNDLLLDQPINY